MNQKDYIKTPMGRALYLLCGYRKQDKRNGYQSACICKCCKKELKTHKGYIWSYEPIELKKG